MASKATRPKAEAAEQGDDGASSKVTKSEAVRRALAEGFEQPAEGVAYIQSKFGIEMGPQHFSAVKSSHRKKQGLPTVNTRFQRRGATTAQPSNEAGLIDTLETLKPLIAQYGADGVKRLVDLLE